MQVASRFVQSQAINSKVVILTGNNQVGNQMVTQVVSQVVTRQVVNKRV
jgi:RNA-binding protein YhbY